MKKLRALAKAALVAACVVVIAGAAGVAYLEYAPRQVPPRQPPLKSLRGEADLSEFLNLFNAASESRRLLVMLSPT